MTKFRIFLPCCFLACFLASGACADDTVRVTVVAPEGSAAEREIVAGVENAFKDAERPVSVRTVHENCSFSADKRQAGEIAASAPDFVIGYTCSFSAVSAQNEYLKAAVPFFAVSTVAPELTSLKNPNVFRLAVNTEKQFDGFAEMLKARCGEKRFLILKDGDVRANKFADVLEKELPEGCFKILDLPANQLEKNINKLSEQSDFKADYIVITSLSSKRAVRLISRVREAGLKEPVIGLNVLKTPDFNRMLGSLKQEVYFLDAEGARYSLDAAPLIAGLRFAGSEPTETMLSSYAAAQIWMQAFGSGTPEPRGKTFETVLGRLVFDDFGDLVALPPQTVYKWSGNTYEEIK